MSFIQFHSVRGIKMRFKDFVLFSFFSLISIALANTTDSLCTATSFPTKKIKDCCYLPRYSNVQVERFCYSQCSPFNQNFDRMKDCVLQCFVHEFDLLNKEGKINKYAAKLMYGRDFDAARNWARIISDGVDKCDVNPFGSLNAKLKHFFDCVETHLAVNCLEFKYWMEDCNEVEDHFEDCRQNSIDCTRLPFGMIDPRDCCLTPRLLSNETVARCREDCESIEFLEPLLNQCLEKCALKATGLRVDEKFDFNVVKSQLLENGKGDFNWTEKINDAIYECQKVIQGFLIKSHV